MGKVIKSFLHFSLLKNYVEYNSFPVPYNIKSFI